MSNAASPPAAGWRAVRLFTGLRLRRYANQLTFMYSRPMGGANRSRPASTPKKRNRWIISVMVLGFMLFAYAGLMRQSIVTLHAALDDASPALPEGALTDALTRGLAMQTTMLVIAAILATLASRELSQGDWDMEWLTTLPLKAETLQWARLVERSVINLFGIMSLWPLCTVLAWITGFRWGAPFIGALGVLPLLLLTAVARTLVDTGLRVSIAPARLRNIHAVLSIVSILVLYSVISLGMSRPVGFLLSWARAFPDWATLLPPGLVVRFLTVDSWLERLAWWLVLAGEVGLLSWAGVKVLGVQLRHGVVSSGPREVGRKSSLIATTQVREERNFGTPVQRRELKLLRRDRTFFVQTLILPLIIVGSQVYLQGRWYSGGSGAPSNTAIAAIAFAVAAYTLMMSAFQTLNSEGGALWILYTVPKPIEEVLREKARLWAILALTYPTLIFGLTLLLRGQVDSQLPGLAAVVLLGVPIYAYIATALGVYAADPLAEDARVRLRPAYVYMYMSLAGIYTYAIFSSQWSQRIVLIVLSGLLAMALWQKARDELPFLLDSAASPPPRVSTSDGVIAAMLFFVVQGIFVALGIATTQGARSISGGAIIVAYSIAGAFTFLLFRYIYWRTKTQGVPKIFGPGVGRALVWGVAAGCAAAVCAIAYLFAIKTSGAFERELEDSAHNLTGSLWIPLLAVVAAPLFEEFIFRGLIFGGMRRSLGLLSSIAGSAAVFAIVHPPLSMIPVFVLGVCAAFAYERGKMLLASMTTHALYNGIVLAAQVYLVMPASSG